MGIEQRLGDPHMRLHDVWSWTPPEGSSHGAFQASEMETVHHGAEPSTPCAGVVLGSGGRAGGNEPDISTGRLLGAALDSR